MEIEALHDVPFMGATIINDGVSFKVWAPHASKVSVVGTFNNWDKQKNELESDGAGNWFGFINGAKEGDEYKYNIVSEFGEFQRNDPYAKKLTNSVGNTIIYNSERFDWGTSDQYNMPGWNKLVIYELHVGSFNVKEEGKPGDFNSLIEKLPYLKSLGINAIEVMPPFEFPGGYSWGYNPASPFAIESEYGGPDGFKAFVKAAHEHEIAVILDVVYNHFGPTDMDLWQFDGWQENDKGGIYFYNDWKSNTPWGDTRPDYGRQEVQQYIFDNAMMWLDEFRVDGLRMDMIPYIRHVNADENPDGLLNDGVDLLKKINQAIAEKYPWKLTIAEDLHGLDEITNAINEGGLGFGSQWDADFVHPVRELLIAQNDEERDMEKAADALQRTYSSDIFKRVIYTESHDEVSNGKARIAEEIAHEDVDNWFSKKRSALGIGMVLTSPGIPMIFQGHELLEDKWFSDDDPIDWSREEKFKGFFKLHQDLIALRTNYHGTTNGLSGQHTTLIRVDQEKKLLAFVRFADLKPKDSTVVILNFSNNSYEDYDFGFPDAGLWKLRFNSDWNGYDPEFGQVHTTDTEATASEMDSLPYSAKVSIAAYAAVIYSQD